MEATGKATILGQEYTWTSPRLKDIEQFEAEIGPITDLSNVNSVKGRVYLAYICLREKHPDLTLGVIGSWPVAAYNELFPMIAAAIPLWEGIQLPPAGAPRERGGDDRPAPSGPDSTPSSSTPPDGSPSAPGDSA